MAVETDDPREYARRVQEHVRDTTRLECTVGIGQNKLQAKLATGFGKPAGVFTITDHTWFDVLGERSTDALWGIGAKTARRLAGLDIRTVRELAGTDPRWLAERLGPMTGPWLVRLASGRDRSPVVSVPYVARGRSREHTFQRNLEDWDQVRREVASLARQVADDIAAQQRQAVRVVTKVRFAPFLTHTHGQALAAPTADPHDIERAALAALAKFTRRRPVRLLGVRAEMVMPGIEAPPAQEAPE
jgi:nucleotidyltransferase/DNA polymerase involved in DNA repair